MYPFFELNDDEREEYRHLQLLEAMSSERMGNPYAAVYRKAHDRLYGKACEWCMKPHLARIERAYQRPPAEPTTTFREQRRHRLANYPRLADLLDALSGDEPPRELRDPE